MRGVFRQLYFWVILGILLGGLAGFLRPELGASLKPLGDGFIALIKMLIGPVIFCTVVLGISGAGDLKKVGRVGIKAVFYFETVSGFALLIGMVVANVLKPGRGFNVDPATLDPAVTAEFARKAGEQSLPSFLLHIIPKTFFDAFSGSGDLLQILLVSLLFGYALNRLGERGKPIHHFIEGTSQIFFGMVNVIMLLAPIGAGGAMAFTIGKYGIASLRPLFALMGTFYLTCALFILLVLGPICAWAGFSVLRFLAYIREELLTVLGTSSSESALVPLMEKLERMGCPKSVVGLVIPSGYSFNLDGTNIYLTMAALFMAQALNVELTLGEQLSLFAVATVTGNGAAGVTGSGFITLAATLAIVPKVPVAGLALIIGVDRFMSEARAITNFIGNGVAAIVISRWERELDAKKLRAALSRPGRRSG